MNKIINSLRLWGTLTCLVVAGLPTPASASTDPGLVAASVGRWLEQGHYTRKKLDEEMSRQFLQTYLTALDYNKLYFTAADVQEFESQYGDTLGAAVLRGDVEPARKIFARFKKRVEERTVKNEPLIEKEYNFDSDQTALLNRQDAAWPKDEAEADTIWSRRIEADLLKEELAEFHIRPPKEAVARRYDRVLRYVREMEDEDVIKVFLSSLAQTYDPHSEYFTPSDLENFQIAMRLSLVGVGAVLTSEDGYAKVREVVPGGPADLDGRLTVNDRIAAVAQDDDEFEDVVDMKLDKVVEKIRGKKNTVVRLLVIPGEASDPAKREIIDIRRDEVKLKDQQAKAEVLDFETGGDTTRIGWITLPSFYANMENKGIFHDKSQDKSTTADVLALLTRLKKEGIEGLVIDLRRDGGGSLEEAINLTGLFIPKGPVVQAKDSNGNISVSRDSDPDVAYTGPLIVLVNRLSASASEIFAAALQDYGRAVIVGDERTFGKGTVQTVLDLGRFIPSFSLGADDAGALKLTIQKFYRVQGGSTQLNGVESNIVLPSLTDNVEIGEGSLKHRLAYDEVAPVEIAKTSSTATHFLDELKRRSSARIAADPDFIYTIGEMQRIREKIESNTISLNEKQRKIELAEENARKEQRDKERASRGPAFAAETYELTLDDVDAPKLRSVAFDRKPSKSELTEITEEGEDGKKEEEDKAQPDPIRNETLRIMQDMIELNRQTKTARVDREEVP